MKKKLRLGIIIAAGVVLVGAGAWGMQWQAKRARQAVCGSDALGKDLKKDTSVLSPTNASMLKPFSEKAEALKGHERSANCMLVLTAYSAYTSDNIKAKDLYAKLQTLRDTGNRVEKDFKEKLANLDDYMKLVDEKQQQYKASTFSSGPGIADPKIGQNAQ